MNAKQRLHSLTPRELQTLEYVARAYPNKAIAFEMNVSIKTVEKFRQHVMDKLQLHDAVSLTHFALHEGLVANIFNVPANIVK